MDWFKFLIIPAIFCYFGTIVYKKIAISYDFVANPNFRNLHSKPLPVGGGIVFSFAIVFSLFFIWLFNKITDDLFWIFTVGGGSAALFGFFDDLKDIRASVKFVVQLLLCGWMLFWLGGGPLLTIDRMPFLVAIPVTIVFLVWVINACNFMDGIDGMAVSNTVFVSGTIISVMLLINSNSEILIVLVLLLTTTSIFMVFNWPPASIFMGDSGSIFIGYTFGALILLTLKSEEINIWTWIIVFGYFLGDTTVTQIMRFILVKKWYLPHRSHAYQNLARISGSHLRVTGSVVMYNVIWILPLTILSVMKPEMELIAVALAIIPCVVTAYKYGPILSSS